MSYRCLTKVTKDENGKEAVSCIYFGTEKCRIHKGVNGCGECNVFAAIINQLHVFEEIIKLNESEGD